MKKIKKNKAEMGYFLNYTSAAISSIWSMWVRISFGRRFSKHMGQGPHLSTLPKIGGNFKYTYIYAYIYIQIYTYINVNIIRAVCVCISSSCRAWYNLKKP